MSKNLVILAMVNNKIIRLIRWICCLNFSRYSVFILTVKVVFLSGRISNINNQRYAVPGTWYSVIVPVLYAVPVCNTMFKKLLWHKYKKRLWDIAGKIKYVTIKFSSCNNINLYNDRYGNDRYGTSQTEQRRRHNVTIFFKQKKYCTIKLCVIV
jgi:hypothetical protein